MIGSLMGFVGCSAVFLVVDMLFVDRQKSIGTVHAYVRTTTSLDRVGPVCPLSEIDMIARANYEQRQTSQARLEVKQ